MTAYFRFMLYVLTSVFKSPRRLAAENIALRHQVLVVPSKNLIRLETLLDRG
jgi:hypothetical protein